MKRCLAILVSMVMMFCVFLTSCGKKVETSGGDTDKTGASTNTTAQITAAQSTNETEAGETQGETGTTSTGSKVGSQPIATTSIPKTESPTTKAPKDSDFNGTQVIRATGAGTFANLPANSADPYYLKKKLGAAPSSANPVKSDEERVFNKDGTWLYDKGTKFNKNGTIQLNDLDNCYAFNTQKFLDSDGAWTCGVSFRPLASHDKRDPESQPICGRLLISDSTQKEVFMVTINILQGRGEDGAEDPNSNQIYYKVQLLAGSSWRDIIASDNWTATRSNQFYLELNYDKAAADNMVHLKIVGDQGTIADVNSVKVKAIATYAANATAMGIATFASSVEFYYWNITTTDPGKVTFPQ